MVVGKGLVRRIVAFLAATMGALAALAAVAAELESAPPAALILTGGRIHTPDGVVDSLAVARDGIIIALGGASDLEHFKTQSTVVIRLDGHAVLPGFHDMHVHPIFAGLQARRCVVPQGSSLKAIQQVVRACAEKAGPGRWITGGQWDASAIGAAPTHAMLDVGAPNNPVLLGDTSEHSAWANARALEIAGITRETPNPPKGIIERDRSGVPTGVLREDAVDLVRSHVPPPTAEEVRAALGSSLREMLSYGITSFTEAAAGYSAGLTKEVSAFAAAADAGVLKQRARLCLIWTPNGEADGMIAARNLYARPRLRPDCIKIFLDGVPTDSHTAAMLEPYEGAVAGRSDEASRMGVLLVSQDVLDRAVIRFDRMGLAVKFHAAGDAAVRAGLNAIEAARKANGFTGPLHDVGHCTFVSKADIPRARAIAATFEVSPYLWGPSPINDDITQAVGARRIARVWPVREMIDSGALVVPGSDWSVVPSVNPWIAVEELVTREKPGGSATSFGKGEAITLEEAIDLFTINSARHRRMEDRLGQIRLGMLADLIVVDRDPYAVPVQELHKTVVLKTLIGGEVVFER